MSPIDDELRAALHGRASLLAPSPDPLAGIERRAKQIRRNRVGAAVAASALAVTAIAVAVPVLQSATSSGPVRPAPFATSGPTPTPTPTPTAYALDPYAPWAYRGDPALAVPGDVDAYTVQWAAEHGVLTDDVAMTLLFGQRYEPSATPEVVYLVRQRSTGDHWWGVAQATESGPELLVDQRLASPARSLAAALPGDEMARLLVVAAPEVGAIQYGVEASEWDSMSPLADGVATGPLAAPGDSDLYQVLDRNGERVDTGEAPDLQSGEQPTGEPVTVLDPASPWELRGDRSLVTDGQLDALGQDWATRSGISAEVEIVPLYVQRYAADAGVEVVYLVRSGDGPWTWGVASLGEGGWAWYAEHEITEPLTALAAALPGGAGRERLLVVAAPSTGGGMYAPDGREYVAMDDLAPGVFVSTIEPGDADDLFMVLDGDGDLDRPVVRAAAPDFQNAG